MAEHQKRSQKKPEEGNQKQQSRQKQSEPISEQFHAWEQGTLPITETPFQPQMDTHAALLANARSDTQRASLVMHLQRTYGNRYVQRLLNSKAVQAKLTVSQPGDIYEQEADRVAEMVTQKISADRVQRQEEEEEVQTKPISQIQRQTEEEEEPIQAQAADSEHPVVSGEVETRINNAQGGGRPLADIVREPMEQAIGADFSGVRVHTDSEADTLNRQLGARAFTTGRDIFFGQGEYSPGSASGRKLLAHELTHVVQQGQGRVKSARKAKKMGKRTTGGASDSKMNKAVNEEPTVGKSTASLKKPAEKGIGPIIQRLVRVDDLKVKHTSTTETETSARQRFDIEAKIKPGSGDHWDFRQDVRGYWNLNGVQQPLTSSGSGLAITKENWVDDGYTKADDTNPGDPLVFKTNDNPGGGFQKDVTETYYLQFRAKIIDTNENNKVIKEKSGYWIKIHGTHPRKFTQGGFD
jgi:hypothetical protein